MAFTATDLMIAVVPPGTEVLPNDAPVAECGSDTHCTDCTNCSDCTGCTGCTECTSCSGCTACTSCSYCTDCTSCSSVTQAGAHEQGDQPTLAALERDLEIAISGR